MAAVCHKTTDGPDCGTPAIVREMGRGFLLELANGKHLEPHGELWPSYAKKDGPKVTISYVSEPAFSGCMMGDGVRLTCIQQ